MHRIPEIDLARLNSLQGIKIEFSRDDEAYAIYHVEAWGSSFDFALTPENKDAWEPEFQLMIIDAMNKPKPTKKRGRKKKSE